MTRLPAIVLISLSLLYATACGDVFVRGSFGSATSFQGTVSTVQLSVTGDVQVTFVTFEQVGPPFTIAFCGNQASRFPLAQNVRVNFNPGQVCSTIVVVIVV